MSHYKRKTTRQSWDQESMQNAIIEVLEHRMGYKKAAQSFEVPRSTLEDRVKKARNSNSVEEASKKGLGRYKPMFGAAQEDELVSHILQMESGLFGFSLSELRILAYELAVRNNINHNFNNENKMAGKSWLYSFLSRHLNLRLRTPEATSIGRAIGFNRAAVGKFFTVLTEVCDQHKFPPERIWNVDKQSKVISMRGKRQIGALVSAERGTLVTAEICMSASGCYMPTMLIFPRKLPNPQLLDHAPPGTFAEFHPSGWIQTGIFIKWFKKFVEFTHPTAESPVLLLRDGHATHTKSLELINLARENHVVIICFPPHCTHRLQPLDVSFMAPLNTYYGEEVRKWMRQHPGRRVTIYEVGELFGEAFVKSAVMQTAINGFRKTGIYPLNPEVFPEWMFAPSETTERELNRQENESTTTNLHKDSGDELDKNSTSSTKQTATKLIAPLAPRANSPQPSCSSSNSHTANQTTKKYITPSTPHATSPQPSCSFSVSASPSSKQATTKCYSLRATSPKSICKFSVSPKEIFPIPKASRKPSNDNRKRGKAAVITSSPYKSELEENFKNSPVVKKLKLDEEDKKKRNVVKKAAPKTKLVPKLPIADSDSSEEEDDLDDVCLYCNELFSNSKSNEGWIKCVACNKWAHEACSAYDETDEEIFICDICS